MSELDRYAQIRIHQSPFLLVIILVACGCCVTHGFPVQPQLSPFLPPIAARRPQWPALTAPAAPLQPHPPPQPRSPKPSITALMKPQLYPAQPHIVPVVVPTTSASSSAHVSLVALCLGIAGLLVGAFFGRNSARRGVQGASLAAAPSFQCAPVQVTVRGAPIRMDAADDGVSEEPRGSDAGGPDADSEVDLAESLEEAVGLVQWMATVDVEKPPEEYPVCEDQEMVIPMFPLRTHAHLPGSKQELNIFEPRYRAMYNDILLNGSRRFAVPMTKPGESGTFAEVASVFYLDDLKEVSEKTNGVVKYQCSHTVIERVRLRRMLNEPVWGDKSSYLKAVAEKFEDCDPDIDLSDKETALEERFRKVIEMQAKVNDQIRFGMDMNDTEEASKISAKRGVEGFWRLAKLWQGLLQTRLQVRENEFESSAQEVLRKYLEDSGVDLSAGKAVQIQVDTLPDNVKGKIAQINLEFAEEAAELQKEAILPFQYLLQMDSHAARLDYFGEMLLNEEKRLAAKNMLRSMFANTETDEDGAASTS